MTEIVNSTSKIILVNISLTDWRYFAQFQPYFDLLTSFLMTLTLAKVKSCNLMKDPQ